MTGEYLREYKISGPYDEDLTINTHAPGFFLKNQEKTYEVFDSRIWIKSGDDFIWLTNQEKMLSHGLSADI